MIFVFGTRYIGGVKSYNSQSIQTKFFHLCYFPLFPVEGESLLVTASGIKTRQGYYMKLNKTSVIAAYTRIPSFVLGVIGLGVGSESHSLFGIITGFALIALGIYLSVYYGRSTREENEERELIGQYTGIYAKADWIAHNICETLYIRMRDAYAAGGSNWKTDLKSGNVADTKRMYAIALINAAFEPGAESEELKEKAAALYKK